MSNMETFYNELHTYVQQVAAKMIDLSGSNPVTSGVIKQALGTYYVVQLKEGDAESSVKAITINSANFKIDDAVYLIKANNTLDSTYYIIGKVEAIQEDFFNLTLSERFQTDKIQKLTEIDQETGQINQTITDSTIINTIKEKSVFQIGGSFSCQKNDADDYGVKVKLYKDNVLIKEYELNTHYFIGQPFKMSAMQQQRTVQLDEATLKSGFDSIKIETFGSDFSYSDVTLSSGFLLNIDGIMKAAIAAINDKNYFSKEGTELANAVQLKASITYDGQDFAANGIQYYWLIKDGNIMESDPQYLAIAGTGWRCLNSYDNVKGINEGKEFTLQLWDNKNNSIIFENDDLFPNFINTMKCIIKYQQITVTSDEFEVYNYNKESFFATIEPNVRPALLILNTDKIELTCQVDDENPQTDIEDYVFKYQWHNSNEIIEGATQKTLNIITGTGYNVDDNIYGLLSEDVELVERFQCIVKIYKNETEVALDNYISEETSDWFEVVSKVAVAAQLKSPTYYKYYISSSPYVTFEKATDDGNNWNGDWIILDPLKDGEEWDQTNLAYWDDTNGQPFEGKQNEDAYNYLKNDVPLSNNSDTGKYLYSTYQTVWYEEKSNKYELLRKENWQYPSMLSGVTKNGNAISDTALEKINVFNQLTEGGAEQGFYLEDVYYRTSDTEKQGGKTYYVKTGENSYGEFEGTSFETGKDYYEFQENKLYINAEFINTGALSVADKEGNRIFYGDIDNGYVEIAGFTIDENSISHGEEATTNYVYLGTDGLKIGDLLSADVENKTASLTGSITIIGTDNTSLGTLEGVTSRKLIAVYSAQDTIPNEKPSTETNNINNENNPIWHTELNIQQDIWMCQKYDIDLQDSAVEWGDITQIASLQPYSISIDNDFISIPTNSIGNISESWTQEKIIMTLYQGTKKIDLPKDIITTKNSSLVEYILYKTENITVNQNGDTFTITDITADKGKLIVEYYKYNELKATATTEVVKQRMGEDGSFVYAIASTNTTKKDLNNGYFPATVDVNIYKRIGGAEPIANDVQIYPYIQKDGGEEQAISGTIVDSFSLSFNGVEETLAIIICNKDNQIIDKILINVVQDGKAVNEIKEFYLLTTLSEGVTKETEGWIEAKTVDIPNPTEDDIAAGRFYLWNYEESYLMGDIEPITSTEPIMIFKYSLDGIGIESITEYYKAFSEEQVFQEAPIEEELIKNWFSSAKTSAETPFVYNCELIKFNTPIGKEKKESQITVPQLVAEQPKISCFIYSSSNTPAIPVFLGSPLSSSDVDWHETQTSTDKWASSKVDYAINSKRVAWGAPYKTQGDSGRNPSSEVYYYYESVSQSSVNDYDILKNAENYTIEEEKGQFFAVPNNSTQWKDENTFFLNWTGRLNSTPLSPNPDGVQTYVWKTLVVTYDDKTFEVWIKPVLVPDLEATSNAAKYQIKDSKYVIEFAGEDYTFPKISLNNSSYNQADSITGNLSTVIGNEAKANKLFPGSTDVEGIGEGDVGRWCRLYDRTVISGGAIVTGTITADAIAANAITADKIDVTDLEAEYIKAGDIFEVSSKDSSNPYLKIYVENDDGGYLKVDTAATDGNIVQVSQLSALSANMGTITAGTIQGANQVYKNQIYKDFTLYSSSYFLYPLDISCKNGYQCSKTFNAKPGSHTVSLIKTYLEETKGISIDSFEPSDDGTLSWGWYGANSSSVTADVYVRSYSQPPLPTYTKIKQSLTINQGVATLTKDGTLTYSFTITGSISFTPSSELETGNLYIRIPIAVFEIFYYQLLGKTVTSGGIIDFSSEGAQYLSFPNLLINQQGVSISGGNINLLSGDARISLGETYPGLVIENTQYSAPNPNYIKLILTGQTIEKKYFGAGGEGELIGYNYTKTLINFNGKTVDYIKYPLLSGRWYVEQLYNDSGQITSSDRNVKNSIQLQPDIYSLLFDKFQPSIFKYNDGASDRYHMGLIAQDVEQAVLDVGLTTQDFAAICFDVNKNTKEKEGYGIRYEELVSMCIYEIQQNKTKIKTLESKVAELENLLYNNN